MFDLKDFIRSRVLAQSLHSPQKAIFSGNRQKILSKSWWIYSDYDIQSRISNQVRSPRKRLLQDGALSIPIYGVNRIIDQSTFQHLLPGFRKEIEMDIILNFVKENGSTTIQNISKFLDLSVKDFEKSVKNGLKTWNLIKYHDKLYYYKEFLNEKDIVPYFHSEPSQLSGNTILKILHIYPYLTISQIALLSGFSKTHIENRIYEVARDSNISRGILRKNSIEEYFNVNQKNEIFDIVWEETPSFILEKRDAFVEILKLESHFEFSEANYWFFLDGIPQAQFNLNKDGKSNQYIVRGFNQLIKSNRDLEEIEFELKQWASKHQIALSIDFTESPYASITKKMIISLQKRGYVFQDGKLSLQINKKSSGQYYNPFSMKKLGSWYLDRQMFGSLLSENEILHELIQLDDLSSLIVRLRPNNSEIDFSNIMYTSGINYRLGFIHKEILPIITKGWPREVRLIRIDHLIMHLLKDNPQSSSQILSKIDQPRNKILSRIRYLEQVRMIQRDLSQGFTIKLPIWKILEISYDSTSEKSLMDIGTILIQILSTNPPLTINQLSKYLGLSFSEINLIKQELLKSDLVVEGYFFDFYQEIQISTPQVVNSIQEKMDSYEEKKENANNIIPKIHLIPHSDPIGIMHFSNLILGNKSLEIKSRNDQASEIWMIMCDSLPSGYILKIPAQEPITNYYIEIRIIPELVEISVLSLIIDNISFLNQFWNNSQLFLKRINNLSLFERKFEQLHFILDSVGILY